MKRRKIMQELRKYADSNKTQSFVRLWAIFDGEPKVIKESPVYGNITVNLIDGTSESEANKLGEYELTELDYLADSQREETQQVNELLLTPPEKNIIYFNKFFEILRYYHVTDLGMIMDKKRLLKRCRCTSEPIRIYEAFVNSMGKEATNE